MIPLGLCSLLMVTVGLLKAGQLLFLDHAPRQVARALRHWQDGDVAQAKNLLVDRRGALPRIAQFAMQHCPPHAAETAVQQIATAELQRLRSGLRTLELIAAIAPLLGLLGTVQGMILAFRQLAAAGSQVDPAILAGGIWVALLTTAVGLLIAIPAVVLHGVFEGHIEHIGQRLEATAHTVFTAHLRATTAHEA